MTRSAHSTPHLTVRPPIPTPVSQPVDTREFLREILHHPHQLGAISPTGGHLAAEAAMLIAVHRGPQVVIELGPGGGAITDYLYARLPAGSTLIGVEANASMAGHLRRTRPWLSVIHGDAMDLPTLMGAFARPADLIVSALPWSLISGDVQRRILTGVAEVLSPDGTFATVVTLPVRPLPAVRQFRRHLDEVFGYVTRTRTVWSNIPPAHLLVARHPYPAPTQVGDGAATVFDRPPARAA